MVPCPQSAAPTHQILFARNSGELPRQRGDAERIERVERTKSGESASGLEPRRDAIGERLGQPGVDLLDAMRRLPGASSGIPACANHRWLFRRSCITRIIARGIVARFTHQAQAKGIGFDLAAAAVTEHGHLADRSGYQSASRAHRARPHGERASEPFAPTDPWRCALALCRASTCPTSPGRERRQADPRSPAATAARHGDEHRRAERRR